MNFRGHPRLGWDHGYLGSFTLCWTPEGSQGAPSVKIPLRVVLVENRIDYFKYIGSNRNDYAIILDETRSLDRLGALWNAPKIKRFSPMGYDLIVCL